MTSIVGEHYAPVQDPDPGVEQDDRAARHRREAIDRLACDEPAAAVTHALLALESRVEELTCFVARLS